MTERTALDSLRVLERTSRRGWGNTLRLGLLLLITSRPVTLAVTAGALLGPVAHVWN